MDNSSFSLSFINLIPDTVKNKIPGYEVLTKPLPGLDFLDQSFDANIFEPKFKVKHRATRKSISKKKVSKDTKLEEKPIRHSMNHIGELEKGTSTAYSIAGIDFIIDERTFVIGGLAIGKQVKVALKPLPGAQLKAISISVLN